MENKRFDKPVHIAFGKPGQHRNVTSVREAAEVLLDEKWPAWDGRRHLAARKACLAVLQGLKEAREARKALKMLLGRQTFSAMRQRARLEVLRLYRAGERRPS